MMILEGKPIRTRIENEVLESSHELRKNGIIPHLAVIMVGHREDSELYVAIKKKRACELGIDFSLYRFEEDETLESVIDTINYLNNDTEIHGIIVQLPLPDNFDTEKVIESIDKNKDVDDLRDDNIFLPPSPMAIVEIIEEYKIETKGKKIVIVGRGRLIGKPLEKILLRKKLDVIAIDSDTKGLIDIIKKADILIVATGTTGMITEELVHKNSVVIGVGDEVNFERVKNHVQSVTPPVGGVGPITVALLLKNVVITAKRR